MKCLLSYILFALICVTAHAQEYGAEIADASSFLDGLRKALSSQVGMSADFVQTKKVKMMKDVQTSKGTFFYQKELNKAALTYTEPAGNKIVISGDKISVVTAGKRTDIKTKSNPALSQFSEMITACLTGDFSSLDSKMNTQYFVDNKTYTLVMTPKSARVKKHISEIVLRFDDSDKTLRLMRLTEANGDYQQYEYYNVTPID